MGNFQPGSPGFWLIAMVILLVVEALAPGLVCIWFALGALAAMFGALGGMLLPGQIVLFLLVSVAALVATRPLVKKYVNSKTQYTNADRILGQECVVTEQIDNLAGTGEIAVGGKRWTARADDQTIIPKDTRVVVERIEGVKAIVKILEGSGR
ncbi:MAG: NfeD family protein [Oscillospiraceae bacterium]|nr:NfeD family protein [Oscillospiraceae bacterium]MBO7423407.1 NfeD family protein [Oscillospiraceae bacterium]MBP5167855.1 NfeD family protein [Oscillospiraceae bacterium]